MKDLEDGIDSYLSFMALSSITRKKSSAQDDKLRTVVKVSVLTEVCFSTQGCEVDSVNLNTVVFLCFCSLLSLPEHSVTCRGQYFSTLVLLTFGSG